jgi:small-conductance mechanosensitive channel
VRHFEPLNAAVVLASAVLALALIPRTPARIARRLRTAVLLAGLAGICHYAVPLFLPRLAGSDDLGAVAFAFGALGVVRVLFVVVVDILVERSGKRPTNALVRDVGQGAIFVFIVAVALRAADLQPGSLIATGTVATAVLGLSLQDTLGNLFAGIAIQMERGVSVGDWMRLDKGDVVGRVVSMNWRAVTVRADDGSVLVVPNGALARMPFTNFTRESVASRRHLYFVLPFEVSPEQAEQAILSACRSCPSVQAEPAPSVMTWTYTERGVTYWLRYWISDFAHRDPSQSDVSTRVWYELHRRKLAPAVPVQHHFVHKMGDRARDEAQEKVFRDRRSVLDSVDFLAPLSDASKNLLATQGHRKLFAEGERILSQGDETRTFYIVRRGEVVVEVDGMEVGRLGPGEFFGELALLAGDRRTATVSATCETEVFEIDDRMFQEVLREEPEVAKRIADIVGQRQAELAALKEGSGRPSMVEVTSWSDEILGKLKRLFTV